MFVTSGQFYVLIASIAFGTVLGLIYSILRFITKRVSNRIVKHLIDIIFFIFGAILFSFYSNLLKFPTFRFYMPISCLLGIVLYIKSFNIILAKFFKMAYNKIKKQGGNSNDGKQV